jgi:hypothetical protein
VEFVATFVSSAPFQHGGFGTDFTSGTPHAVFTTWNDGKLHVRTGDTVHVIADTVLSTSYLGAPHMYKVVWQATQVDYYIDGVKVATHGSLTYGTRQMRPLFADTNVGGPTLAIDWVGTSSATLSTSIVFTSRVLDAGKSVKWLSAQWDGVKYADALLRMEVRTGSTPTYSSSTWSAWVPVGGAALTNASNRYLQYQLLTTGGYLSDTVVKSVRFFYQ